MPCRSLRQLLQYEGPGSVEDVFCQTFTVEVPAYGENKTVPLQPGGDALPVTEENRREFVELYVDFWLNRSVHKQVGMVGVRIQVITRIADHPGGWQHHTGRAILAGLPMTRWRELTGCGVMPVSFHEGFKSSLQ